MKNLIRLSELKYEDVLKIFEIADELIQGKYKDFLKGKTAVLFFPLNSIRTRVTFEKGIYLLGGQSILFESSTIDKKEKINDVVGYLNNWADLLIVRHADISMLDNISLCAAMPVINAMTSANHPCEMLADLYSLSKIRDNYINDKYLFVGPSGNIGKAWKEASELAGFSLEQCCPEGYELDGIKCHHNLNEAVVGKDIICTDSLSGDKLQDFKPFQISIDTMKAANPGALLNPCPPFFRGEEVSAEVIDSKYFAGYDFKKHLLEIQQAIIIYLMQER